MSLNDYDFIKFEYVNIYDVWLMSKSIQNLGSILLLKFYINLEF